MELTSGAVTALIDRLERAGWVSRVPNPGDRRSVLLELSPTARAAGAEQLGSYEAAVESATERVSASPRETDPRWPASCGLSPTRRAIRVRRASPLKKALSGLTTSSEGCGRFAPGGPSGYQR